MTADASPKLVVVVTHGGEDPERATIPFVVANAALAMESRVAVVLQANGVTLGTKGLYEHVLAPGFEPVKKMVDTFLELKGELLVCIPCLETRKIPVDTLVPGAQAVKAGRVAQELLDATNSVSY